MDLYDIEKFNKRLQVKLQIEVLFVASIDPVSFTVLRPKPRPALTK